MTAPQLPYELIRIIFELAASESHHTALTLLLVSHEAHNWLERQIYATVRIKSRVERGTFEKCRIARNDDAFFANAVRKLRTWLDPTILSVCTNVTHLVLSQQYIYRNAPPTPTSLRHLKNLKYLALLEVDDDYSLDTLPPNITHVQLRSSNIKTDDYLLPQFTRDCPFLSHVMLDWVDFDQEEVFSRLPVVPTNLPPQCCCIAVTVPCALLLDYDRLKEMREMQRRYPQLLLINVDASKGVVMENVFQCDYSLVLRLEFWDEMKEALGRAQRNPLQCDKSDEKGYHWVFTDSGYGGHRRRFEFWDEFVSHERHSLLIMMLQAIVNGHERLQRRLWCALNGPQRPQLKHS